MANPIVAMEVSFEENSSGDAELIRKLTAQASHVDIGVHSISGEELVMIASVNEFGASLPGGQPFLILDRAARKDRSNEIPLDDGKTLMFLKKGSKGMGVTKPSTIPARSYVRSTMDVNREKYQVQAQREWNAILEGSRSTQESLAALGQLVQQDIQNTVRTLKEPPNSKLTAARKGSDNPLINIGTLVNSIRWIVKNNQDQNVEIGT